MLEGRQRKLDRTAKQNRSSPSVRPKDSSINDNNFRSPNECNTMTRKPIRTRRPRIPILQSGYCAICNLPYNSVEDHIQSKKHQKLIGEDANYIALNGYIHSDVGIESLLSLTGIDAIGFDDFTSPKAKRRRTMPRTRASSVASDIVKPETGHRLRSRKNINYMTPPLEDDSLQDKPDLEPVRLQYKEYRELRSSTRALAKLTALQSNGGQEVWDSGRPKRACIGRQKRISADERLVGDNKTYYKVEVLSNKLRSSDKGTTKQPKESKPDETDKGLIVKFKKLRNSELIQLNNEATNFLFPKKDDSTDEEEEEEGQENGVEHDADEKESVGTENNEVSSSSELDDIRLPENFKVEDETSMDSVSSDFKKKKKRRSQAEAFIMDNQKYYKFETPCSRLRYHGSYLSPLPVKPNGECVTKTEIKNELKREQNEHDKEKEERLKLNLDEFKFSFETVPQNEKWYKTFQRQDRSEQRYDFSTNYYWDDFVMPYQIPHLKPIDPRTCYHTYKDLSKAIQEALNQSHVEELLAESDTNLPSETNESPTENAEEKEKETNILIEQIDEDSKLSEVSVASSCVSEEVAVPERRIGRPRKCLSLSPGIIAKNPRKSPRQHASTLAILSSLVQQRKRRSRNAGIVESPASLPVIPEEPVPVVEEKATSSPQKPRKKKVDYFALAAAIDEELSTALESNFDEDFEPTTEPDFLTFKESNLTVDDIMKMYEDRNAKENASSCRKFFNKAPRRKPGKRKKNKTGWPNKVKKRKMVKEGEQEGTSEEVNRNESDDDIDNDDENEDSDSIIDMEGIHKELAESSHDDLDVNQDRENNCDKVAANRVGNSSKIRDTILQPYVYVKKLESYEHPSVKKLIRSSRRVRPQRRKVTASPKSPRILRRPKGRWYRER